MTRCPWCGGKNDGILLLCNPEKGLSCERQAVIWRKRAGLTIRQTPPLVTAGSEPDD